MGTQQDESRFAHLLQPIRDLAANWDIDVAKELEEYLVSPSHYTPHYGGLQDRGFGDQQKDRAFGDKQSVQETLEDLTFAFDGGPTLNFAEGSWADHAQRFCLQLEKRARH